MYAIVSMAMVLEGVEGRENALCNNSVQYGKMSPQYVGSEPDSVLFLWEYCYKAVDGSLH